MMEQLRFKLNILFYLLRYTLRGSFRKRTQLERFQQRQWRRFRKTVLSRSPFYRDLARQGAPLEAFPRMDKARFMQHFDAINTRAIPYEAAMDLALKAESDRDFSANIQNITVGLSTGTSGTRGLFLVSPQERAQWTAMVLRRVVPIRWFKSQKVAFFLRANSNLYSSVQSALLEFRFFDIFQPIDQLAADLAAFQPAILAAQPSVLAALAERQLDGRLQIQPELLISFAEVLYAADKTYIQQAFPVPLREVYQCTEGFLGVSCPYGTIHLNEDIAIFEKKYLDESRFIPIVTDFTRSTQPVVRYELNDVLVEKTSPCPCGSCFTALERIEGREDDLLQFVDLAGQAVVVFPDLICRVIARSSAEFRAYRVQQLGSHQLQLELESPDFPAVAAQLSQALQQFLAERHIDGVEIRCVEGITRVPGSKLRRVEQKMIS